MLVYEVDLDVDAAVEAEYLAWLRVHMREIRALDGFTGARLWRVHDPAPAVGRVALCVRYGLRDVASLETYLRDHAPRLREEGLRRFDGRFVASRRVMQMIDEA